jgi:hypothetical protein
MVWRASPFRKITLPSRTHRNGDEMPRNSKSVTRIHARIRAALSCLTLLLGCAHSQPLTGQGDGGATSNEASAADGGANLGTRSDWCAARTVLRDKCQRCHQDPTQNGAPFALLTYADTQVADRKGVPRFQKMKAALETDYMPPMFLKLEPAVEVLRAAERDSLLSWLSSDPPLDSPDCD